MKSLITSSDSGLEPVNGRIKSRGLPALRSAFAWAALLTLVVVLFALWPGSEPSENPFLAVGMFALIGAAVICERLGIGQFNILGSSTIPDAILLPLTVIIIYGFSLLLVLIVKGIYRIVRATMKSKT
jgi:hypothetical protein